MAAPIQNLYFGTIPPADLAQAFALLRQGANLLQPHLTLPTSAQRRQMLKLDAASVSFVAKTCSYAAENPDFRPFFLNFEEFAHAADALVGLSALAQLLAAPHLDTDSTLMTVVPMLTPMPCWCTST